MGHVSCPSTSTPTSADPRLPRRRDGRPSPSCSTVSSRVGWRKIPVRGSRLRVRWPVAARAALAAPPHRGVRRPAPASVDEPPRSAQAAGVRPSPLAAPAGDRLLNGHTSAVYAVATAQLGGAPVVVSGSRDSTVRVWDLATGVPVGPAITGHAGSVRAVAAAQLNGRPVVVSGGDDRTVRVWDMGTGTPVGPPLTGHTYAVCAVATVQLGGRPVVVSGSHDKTVRIWDLVARAGAAAG